jgi:RNA polymerase sigma factor (sigma-70 family)
MAANDLELLGQFAREHSQDAFTELVKRHLGLVYSAAIRQVRSPHLAEEIAQSVFTNLARHAAKLAPDTILTAWLYRATRNAAIDLIRSEARRQAREQLSLQMSAMNDSPADWSHIEPLLDEAMDSLEDADRTAILLRYFEKKSLSEVGTALGTGEDAAQKRVSRAVERLREFFSKRKVAVGASALVALLSANAVQAVPIALTTTVATGAVLATTTLSTATTTTTIAIAMTTAQKIIVAVLLTGAVAAGIYEGVQASNLREQVKTLQQQQEQNADQQKQFDRLKHERDDATVKLAQIADENNSLKKRPADVLKLRNEVGQLKRENTEMGSKSALSKMTADPETRKMMRDQQKMGIGMLYKGYFDQTKMAPDMKEKLSDLLADHVMQNVDTITTLLRDKPPKEQFDQAFAAQNAALQQDVATMLGPDGLAQYNEYSKNLLSSLTTDQFKEMLTGTDAEKAAKSQQLMQVMQTEVASALAGANLPANYQALPIMNFANIASEDQGNQSLALLQSIYDKVAAQSGSFLSADELAKFQKFTATAVSNNRMGLSMNRTMMAPIGK